MRVEALSYEQFIVEATDLKQTGSFRVRVLASPVGGMRSDAAVRVRCKWNELAATVNRLRARALKEEELVAFGRRLADLLLPVGIIRDLYQQSVDRTQNQGKGLRLRLRFEHHKLAEVPWEFLYVDRGRMQANPAINFLALQPSISITRNDIESPTIELPSTVTRIHLLGVLSPLRGQVRPNAYQEKEVIQKAVDVINNGKQAVRTVWLADPTREEFLEALDSDVQRADILHFAGQGAAPDSNVIGPDHGLTAEPVEEPGILLLREDRRHPDFYPSSMLATALAGRGTRFAMLNTSYLGPGALQCLTQAGVIAAISQHGLASDEGAMHFAARVYSSLTLDYSIDEAVARARKILYNLYGLQRTDWGQFVLSLQARSGFLFPTPADFGVMPQEPSPLTVIRENAPKDIDNPVPLPPIYRSYHNLDIEMTDLKDDGSFSVRILNRTRGGEMPPGEVERPTFDSRDEEFARLLGKLERRKASRDELIELGRKLGDLLLPGRVREIYWANLTRLGRNEGLRLRLRIFPLKLAALPWEYAYVQRNVDAKADSDFLGLQRKVSITRYETTGAGLDPLEAKAGIRITAVLASPIDEPALDLEADKRAIQAAIEDLKKKAQGVDSVIVEQATRERLFEAISGSDIFHFAGHGVFEPTGEISPQGMPLRKGKIVLETPQSQADRYDSDQLATLLSGEDVRLTVLGACNSAARDEGGAWTGVAPALVRENIPAVVAMQYRVLDTNAGTLMAHLYARVLGGYTVDEALSEGRRAIYNRGGLEERDWGVPVLYLRSEDGVVFPLPPAGTAGGAPVAQLQREMSAVGSEDIAPALKK